MQKSGRPHVHSRPQRARQTGVINEKSSPRGALQVFGQHDVRGLLVDLVLVDGQSLVDVDRVEGLDAYYADFATPFHVPLLHRSAVG